MSHDANERRFWFNGNAMAVGGRITGPISESIDPQGAVVLPPGGGFGSVSVDNFNFRNIVRFDRVTSTVSGQKVRHRDAISGKTVTSGETLVTVAIEGLNILDVVTADRVVARITSQHEEDEYESKILPFGSHFENLRIGGVPIELEARSQLLSVGRYKEMIQSRQDYSDGMLFTDANDNQAGGIKSQTKGKTKAARARDETTASHLPPDRALLAPLFRLDREKGTIPPGCELIGRHGIKVPGFGVIYLGEYLVTRTTRRLIMLRAELGCPISGSIVCDDAGGNGHWDP